MFRRGPCLAAAFVGLAACATEAPDAPSQPTVAIETPDGTGAVTGISVLRFGARVTGLTAPSLAWSFGDGANAVGASVTHRFDAEGSPAVTVTATGTEGVATATVSVRSRTLTGRWVSTVLPCPANLSCWVNDLVQQGTVLTGQWTFSYADTDPRREPRGSLVNAVATSPRGITFTQDGDCRRVFRGTMDPSLESITGTTVEVLNFSCAFGESWTFRRQ